MRLRDVPDEWLLCFTTPHAMRAFDPGPGDYDGPGWGDTYHLRCERCPTIRHVTLDSLGEISTSYYERTPARRAYLEARREAVVAGRGDARLEHLRRTQAERRAARKARTSKLRVVR